MSEEYIETNVGIENWLQDEDAFKSLFLSTIKNIDISLRKIANYFDHK